MFRTKSSQTHPRKKIAQLETISLAEGNPEEARWFTLKKEKPHLLLNASRNTLKPKTRKLKNLKRNTHLSNKLSVMNTNMNTNMSTNMNANMSTNMNTNMKIMITKTKISCCSKRLKQEKTLRKKRQCIE